jgi:hypothetical protein
VACAIEAGCVTDTIKLLCWRFADWAGAWQGANDSSPKRADQTWRLGLTVLNHQTRIAPTTTTNKIVNFIAFP